MGNVSLVFSISKDAAKLIKAGKAVLSSGGVRDLLGRMIEQAVPVATSSLSLAKIHPALACVNLASSLGNNVQSAFIQAGVDTANRKLDDVLTQLGKLSNALDGLQTIEALSWIGTSFSIANCAISVVGLRMTMKRLDSIEAKIDEFREEYEKDRADDKIEHFHTIVSNLKDHLGMLTKRRENESYADSLKHDETHIAQTINEAISFLDSIKKDFITGKLDGEIACTIIFTLSALLAQVVNEFCCQYYYAHHAVHTLYKEWASALESIDSPDFRKALKSFFQISEEFIGISPVQKAAAFHVATESMHQGTERLAAYSALIPTINEQQYFHLDDTLNKQLYLELPNVLEGIKDSSSLDSRITENILAGKYIVMPEGETVMIPVD